MSGQKKAALFVPKRGCGIEFEISEITKLVV